jgi:6-phosphofructokinase 1
MAGSEAGNSRVKISKIDDLQKYHRIKAGLEKHSIDALIIAGGDDTGSVVVDLNKNGIPCIHVPKTMDLDLHTYSVGGDSSVNRIANYIEEIKTTGRTHNRIMILEVFGRYSGQTTFRGGVAGDADCILIPEIPVDFGIVYEHLSKTIMRRIRESDTHNGTYAIVVNEGIHDHTGIKTADNTVAVDAFGHKKLGGSGKYVREQLNKLLKADIEMQAFYKEMGLFVQDMNMFPEIRESVPGYLSRSGYSSALDVNFGKDVGAGAVILLKNGITGVTVTGVSRGRVQYMDIQKAIEQRLVDMNMVSFYECMGICFGRKPERYKAESKEATDGVWEYL